MSHLPYTLAEIPTKVFETGAGRRSWCLGDPFLGHEVTVKKGKLAELTASFYFVLPPLPPGHGPVSLLTIARGLAGDSSAPPEFMDSAALLEVFGGVYLHAAYDPSRCRFEALMNAGSEVGELVGVTLKGAPPELVCGRLLQFYVEINSERIFASVNDRFAGEDVTEGEDADAVALDGLAPSTGGNCAPGGAEGENRILWGASPRGLWWVVIGLPDTGDERSALLPPGFGLSDLRITLGSELDDAVGSLAYSGELDHLVAARPVEVPKRVPDWEVRALLRHAASLRAVADDLDRIRLLLPIASLSSIGDPSLSAREILPPAP